jgi:hypothetical protein
MKTKENFYLIIALLSLIIIWLFIGKRKRAVKTDRIIKRLRKDNYETKKAYLGLLEKYLKTEKNVDIGIIAELQKLRQSIDTLDFEVHIELEAVIKNLNDGKPEEAVRILAKVVENKLKEKAIKDDSFKGKPMLHNLLEFAKNCNLITVRQYENGMLLKDIRNKESHELVVLEETKNLGLCIFSGIDIIYSLR